MLLKVISDDMIIDDTLREGLQAPGISFTIEEKLELAKLISSAGVEEAVVSHPSAHESEVEVTRLIVERGYFRRVFGLGRAVREDIDLIASINANISTYVPFEPDLAARSLDIIRYAVNSYGRGRLLIEVGITNIAAYDVKQAIKLAKELEEIGVDRIQLADSTGRALPRSIDMIVRGVKEVVKIPISVHFHNDYGLAITNALTAVHAGADYVDTTVYGIGERNGITDLITIANALRLEGYDVRVDLERVRQAYDYLARLIIEKVGLEFFLNNFPVVGLNLGIQTAGTHAAYSGVFKERYYSLNVYVGRSMLRRILGELGISVNDEELTMLVKRVKDMAVKTGRAVTTQQLLDLLREVRGGR